MKNTNSSFICQILSHNRLEISLRQKEYQTLGKYLWKRLDKDISDQDLQ